MNDVELVDISPFTSSTATPTEAAKIAVAQDVTRALSTKGFVHLIGHGISEELIESAFSITGEFFTGTDDSKQEACSKYRAKRGYSPCHSENFASLLGMMHTPNDSVEKFRCGPMVDDVTRDQDPTYYNRWVDTSMILFYVHSYNIDTSPSHTHPSYIHIYPGHDIPTLFSIF